VPFEVPPGATAADLTRELDASRRRLYKLVRAADPKALAKRPPSGAWSALENVRHLLFAEQLHFGRLLEVKTDFSPLGVTGMRAKQFAPVGAAKPTLEEVLSAWDDLRAAHRKSFKGREDEAVRRVIYGNTRHVQVHMVVIEQLLQGKT